MGTSQENTSLNLKNALLASIAESVNDYGDDERLEYLRTEIFNEARLYEALGKEAGRTVLAIFSQYCKWLPLAKMAAVLAEPNDYFVVRDLQYRVHEAISKIVKDEIEKQKKDLEELIEYRKKYKELRD